MLLSAQKQLIGKKKAPIGDETPDWQPGVEMWRQQRRRNIAVNRCEVHDGVTESQVNGAGMPFVNGMAEQAEKEGMTWNRMS